MLITALTGSRPSDSIRSMAFFMVNDDLDPKDFTIRNALDRMESMGEDPVLPVLTDKPKLAKTLARLDALLKG